MAQGMKDFFVEYNTKRRHSSIRNEVPEKLYNERLIGISNSPQN
jgi:hypothetical protein